MRPFPGRFLRVIAKKKGLFARDDCSEGMRVESRPYGAYGAAATNSCGLSMFCERGRSRVTKLLDEKDVLRLLREDVDKAGGQSAWARQTRVERLLALRDVQDIGNFIALGAD
jgi:hypothetical protein